MDAGPFDLRAKALGRGIVDAQEHPLLILEDASEHQHQDPPAQFLPTLSHTLEEEVVVLVIRADSGRANPRGDDPPPAREEDSHHQDGQPPARPAVETRRQPFGPLFPFARGAVTCHPWLSGAFLMSLSNTSVPEEPLSCGDQFQTTKTARFLRKCRQVDTSGKLFRECTIYRFFWQCSCVFPQHASFSGDTLPKARRYCEDRIDHDWYANRGRIVRCKDATAMLVLRRFAFILMILSTVAGCTNRVFATQFCPPIRQSY